MLANIFMAKLEEDVVRQYTPPFYDRYVDDCFSKKVENESDRMLERLNNCHRNIKFTVGEKPNQTWTMLLSMKNKLSTAVWYSHWYSQVPTNWKRNSMVGALHREKRLSTNLESDIKEITEFYLKAGSPKRVIQATINRFRHQTDKEESLIPEYTFDESTRLPPMWPGFDSQTRRHMWVEFVGSLLCTERFFSGYSGFPLSLKTNILFYLR